jgi:hypothetical protein
MSEPDNPRWLQDLSGELRADVPVRPAWRARLIDEIARAPRPHVGDPDMRELGSDTGEMDHSIERLVHGRRLTRRLVLHPFAAVAAALAFAALGAAAALSLSRVRGSSSSGDSMVAAVGSSARGATGAGALPVADATTDQAVVRFELSAPTASRVAIVGSFNRWNPVATPLARDPATGKWMVSLRLPAGRHVYAFVVDGDVTADPAAPRAADADFGTPNSVVLVSGRSS